MSRRRDTHRSPAFTGTTPIAVECPGCRAHVAVPPPLVGHAAGCPVCWTAFFVPAPEREVSPATASPDRPKRKRRRRAPAEPTTEAPSADPGSATAKPAPGGESQTAAPATREEQPRRDDHIAFTEPPPPRSRDRHGTADAVGLGAAADHAAGHFGDPAAHPVSAPDSPAAFGVGPGRPDPASDSGALAFREPVKTIRAGDTDIELRQLTPEERRTRRARRNLVLLVVGATLLVALATLLGRGGR